MCGSNDNLPVFASRRMNMRQPGADERQPEATERDYNRSTQFVGPLIDSIFGGPQKSGTQTTTQQNLPAFAIPDAMSTLAMGNYYTQNPDYRPGSLDRDYSAVRGLNQYGEPLSQAGSFGLAPAGFQAQPRPNPPGMRPTMGNLVSANLTSSRGGGRSKSYEFPQINLPDIDLGGGNVKPIPSGGPSGTSGPSGETQSYQEILNESSGNQSSNTTSSSNNNQQSTTPAADLEPEPIDPKTIFDPNNITPFAYYDRQRFAAPGAGTVRGENLLQGRYDQRFGPGGSNPFSAAQNAMNQAADFRSSYTGTNTTAGGFQAGLADAQDPRVFQGRNYSAGLDNKFSNPNAGMTATQYGNANQSLAGPVDYQQQKTLQQGMQQFLNPYTDQVVNQSLKDLDRARIMSNQNISSSAAKAGAFGGSREALMRSENNRNFLDRAGALAGQL